MGILIAIDGVDASGKETQSNMLYDFLKASGKKVRKITFPAYESPSSVLVKQYLSGAFGTQAQDVNAYAASTFFAADRFATFKQDWQKDYEKKDSIIIADRYVSSNMIHQAGKLKNALEKEAFLEWLWDFEFEKLALPKPNLTLFLDMPPEFAAVLMQDRANKIDGTDQKDIHERDMKYLKASYENACYVAQKYHWDIIPCVQENKIRPVSEIQEQVRKEVNALLASY